MQQLGVGIPPWAPSEDEVWGTKQTSDEERFAHAFRTCGYTSGCRSGFGVGTGSWPS